MAKKIGHGINHIYASLVGAVLLSLFYFSFTILGTNVIIIGLAFAVVTGLLSYKKGLLLAVSYSVAIFLATVFSQYAFVFFMLLVSGSITETSCLNICVGSPVLFYFMLVVNLVLFLSQIILLRKQS